MRRSAFIIAFVGAFTFLFLLLVFTQQAVAFLPFAFLYIIGFAGQVVMVYCGSQWAGISLKSLYPLAVLMACGLLLIAVAWLSGNSLAFLLSGFFRKGGLGLAVAPYIVANLMAYILVIIRKPTLKHTL